jgi:hypothetical protein
MTIDLDLPDLDADAEIAADNIRAAGTIYSAWMLENAGVFQVLERIVELFSQGMLPVGQGRAGRALYRIWRQSERMSARERATFYSLTLGVPGGDASAAEPNREFLSLWLRFLVAVSMYGRQRGAAGLVVPPTPANAAVCTAARSLAANASTHGTATVRSAARRLIVETRQMFDVLNEPELLRALDAPTVWQLIDRVHREHLGGASNVARYRSQARAGSRVFDWLADHAAALHDSTTQPDSPQDDVELVEAAELLLAMSAGEATVEPRPDLLFAAHELVAALDLAGERDRTHAGRDIAALFHGPPGTGKTLAAHVLAQALSLDLLRIDLAAVTSKYIGETEKNLAAAFERAERSGAALFFDEADALFGRRSDVRDSHGRYASTAIDTVLRRLRDYEGTLIVAVSPQVNVEAALAADQWRRRWRVVRFPRPGG